MKAKYLKPTAEDLLLTSDELMIATSVGGQSIVEDGGNTTDAGITEADSRRKSLWESDDEVEY